MRLRFSGARNLARARLAITEVVGQVRRRAEVLELTASDYRREANHLDALAAEAASAAALAGVTPPPVVFDPVQSSRAPVPHGVR